VKDIDSPRSKRCEGKCLSFKQRAFGKELQETHQEMRNPKRLFKIYDNIIQVLKMQKENKTNIGAQNPY